MISEKKRDEQLCVEGNLRFRPSSISAHQWIIYSHHNHAGCLITLVWLQWLDATVAYKRG